MIERLAPTAQCADMLGILRTGNFLADVLYNRATGGDFGPGWQAITV
jgi:hypothetical protein